MSIKIEWQRQYSNDNSPIGWIGKDTEGNVYEQGELRETTSVTLVDGRTGGDWTPEGALEAAESRPLLIPYILTDHISAESEAAANITDDGAEFLAAIQYLEGHPDRPYQYLGWQISSHGFYQAWKEGFYLRCLTARDLITAIYTLETNGVTAPATDEEMGVPQ